MKASPTPLDQAIDRLLADAWEGTEQRTDASELLQRVRQSRQVDAAVFSPIPPAPPTTNATATATAGRARGWAWALPALAAVVFLAALLAVRQNHHARAAGALRDLRTTHLGQTDRLYRVHYTPDPRYGNQANPLEGPSHSLLWTRGDRFWSDCTIGELRLRIGRQHDGTLWLRSSPQQAIEFVTAPSQLPQEVALLCAANSLSVPRLVEEVLADFDLRPAPPPDSSGTTPLVVWASLKPQRVHPVISSALLEIDPQDHSLTRLVLWMVRGGQPRGTVAYTFLDSGVQDDSLYELRAHLDADARIERHRLSESEEG